MIELGENASWWKARVLGHEGPIYEFEVGGSWRGAEQLRSRRLYRVTAIEVRKSDGYIQATGVRMVADGAGGYRKAKSEGWAAIVQESMRKARWVA